MITAVHNLIYSDDAAATRNFFRDVIGLPFVTDAGSEPGWLIFKAGPSELGVHPTSGGAGDEAWSHPRQHAISLICDDITATVEELRSRGAGFSGDVEDRGFGLVAMLQVPGADDIMVYEPRHTTAHNL